MFLRGIFQGLFGAKNLKYIPKAIVHLANDSSHQGAAVEEIKFPQLLAYAEVNGQLLSQQANYFEFSIDLDETNYLVKATRAYDGSNCAIIRSSYA